ncbi:hypothetical protein ACFQAT_26970 [Undibacterium arcticum]|uniref:Uncharacterized protein n=1 Tax=Undibacterium arcticum TaxID=1762892 RepID=A0ABV7F0F5_9BURK
MGPVAQIDNGIVAVMTLTNNAIIGWTWHRAGLPSGADGKEDPSFQIKPQIALTLIECAEAAGIGFRAFMGGLLTASATRTAGPVNSGALAHAVLARILEQALTS